MEGRRQMGGRGWREKGVRSEGWEGGREGDREGKG